MTNPSVGVAGFISRYQKKETFWFENGKGLEGCVMIGYAGEDPDAVLAYAREIKTGKDIGMHSIPFAVNSHISRDDAFSRGLSMLDIFAHGGEWTPSKPR